MVIIIMKNFKDHLSDIAPFSCHYNNRIKVCSCCLFPEYKPISTHGFLCWYGCLECPSSWFLEFTSLCSGHLKVTYLDMSSLHLSSLTNCYLLFIYFAFGFSKSFYIEHHEHIINNLFAILIYECKLKQIHADDYL